MFVRGGGGHHDPIPRRRSVTRRLQHPPSYVFTTTDYGDYWVHESIRITPWQPREPFRAGGRTPLWGYSSRRSSSSGWRWGRVRRELTVKDAAVLHFGRGATAMRGAKHNTGSKTCDKPTRYLRSRHLLCPKRPKPYDNQNTYNHASTMQTEQWRLCKGRERALTYSPGFESCPAPVPASN